MEILQNAIRARDNGSTRLRETQSFLVVTINPTRREEAQEGSSVPRLSLASSAKSRDTTRRTARISSYLFGGLIRVARVAKDYVVGECFRQLFLGPTT